MKAVRYVWILLVMLPLAGVQAGPAVDSLMQDYARAGVTRADADAGAQFWQREVNTVGEPRRCATCHGTDLRLPGKHATTGKPIDPMAPSVNPERLTETRKINKWFTRNCKWTLDRECSAQEKADVLAYLQSL